MVHSRELSSNRFRETSMISGTGRPVPSCHDWDSNRFSRTTGHWRCRELNSFPRFQGIPTPFPTVGSACLVRITHIYRPTAAVSPRVRIPEFNGF